MSGKHFSVLNGWRGLSIIFVLSAHLLPLGSPVYSLNLALGALGMVLFFIMSGFLVTDLLIRDPDLVGFVVKRFARIFPLFFVCALVAYCFFDLATTDFFATIGFYANLPPQKLVPVTAHFWSLCVEVQFYLLIAAISIFRPTWFYFVVAMAVGVTLLRVFYGYPFSSITYYRVDEIFAGSILAFLVHSKYNEVCAKKLAIIPIRVILFLLLLSCHPFFLYLCYFRPYLAMLLIGRTLLVGGARNSILNSKWLKYIAEISYALYIIHPFLAHSWLGEGDKVVEYAKRPLLFLVLWALAHFSTRNFESIFTDWAKKAMIKRQ